MAREGPKRSRVHFRLRRNWGVKRRSKLFELCDCHKVSWARVWWYIALYHARHLLECLRWLFLNRNVDIVSIHSKLVKWTHPFFIQCRCIALVCLFVWKCFHGNGLESPTSFQFTWKLFYTLFRLWRSGSMIEYVTENIPKMPQSVENLSFFFLDPIILPFSWAISDFPHSSNQREGAKESWVSVKGANFNQSTESKSLRGLVEVRISGRTEIWNERNIMPRSHRCFAPLLQVSESNSE